MRAPFKVGEILIGQNMIMVTRCNGMECEVIGGLEMRDWRCEITGDFGQSMTYEVRWADGGVTVQEQNELRRRKPPAADSNERRFVQLWRDMAGKLSQGVPA